MLRVLWRSFLEPLRSVGSVLILAGCGLSLWFVVAVLLLVAERREFIPWTLADLDTVVAVCMLLPILALTLPVIATEAKDRTLLLNLMQPIPRVHYYTGRVLGRGLLGIAYFALTLGGLYTLIAVVVGSIFQDTTGVVPPDLAARIVFVGLSLVSIVFSLCALAPVSSSRYGHVAYWAGFYVIVRLARDLAAAPETSGLGRIFATTVLEVLQPFLIGVAPGFVDTAALGSWYLWRAVLQWGFGLSLAYLVGVFAFSRMEVARRT